MYEGHRKNLLLMQQRSALSVVTGFNRVEERIGVILVVDVKARVSGSITDIKLRLPATSGRKEDAATDFRVIYTFAAVAIAAKGVFAFLIYPGGTENIEGWNGVIDGPVPSEFEVEVVQAAGTDMTWQLDALWLP